MYWQCEGIMEIVQRRTEVIVLYLIALNTQKLQWQCEDIMEIVERRTEVVVFYLIAFNRNTQHFL